MNLIKFPKTYRYVKKNIFINNFNFTAIYNNLDSHAFDNGRSGLRARTMHMPYAAVE